MTTMLGMLTVGQLARRIGSHRDIRESCVSRSRFTFTPQRAMETDAGDKRPPSPPSRAPPWVRDRTVSVPKQAGKRSSRAAPSSDRPRRGINRQACGCWPVDGTVACGVRPPRASSGLSYLDRRESNSWKRIRRGTTLTLPSRSDPFCSLGLQDLAFVASYRHWRRSGKFALRHWHREGYDDRMRWGAQRPSCRP